MPEDTAARLLRGLLIGSAVAGAALAAGSFALAHLSVHPPRWPFRATPGDDGMPFDEVDVLSRDGVRLSGWFVPHPEAIGGIVICHGHPFNKGEMMPWARALYPAGFHLLLFDFRAMGRSDGKLCTLGRDEVGDVLGAVDYLESRPEMRGLPMGLFGLSMGGAASIMASAQDDRIRALATHGAFAGLDRAIRQRGRLFLGPLGPLLSVPALWWGRMLAGVDPSQIAPAEVIGRIDPRPLLLYHGEWDPIVPPADAHVLHAAAGPSAELHVVPRSWHVHINEPERAAYGDRLRRFYVAALGKTGGG